jgi:Leucine-rich repeat (LRR) protein
VVDLSYNKLSTCPRDILGCINSLLVLNLSYNRLETWPTGLHMPALVVLNLSFNKLQQLPPDLGQQMPALQQLYLANNFLKELPDSLAQLELRDLFVSENDLQVVPKVGPSCSCQLLQQAGKPWRLSDSRLPLPSAPCTLFLVQTWPIAFSRTDLHARSCGCACRCSLSAPRL